MSSKFNPSVAGKALVPYCQPGPLVPLPIIPLPPGVLPPFVPSWLVAYAHWYDWDTEPGPYLSASMQLPLVGPEPTWHGSSGPPYPYLEVRVWFHIKPSNWNVTLWVYRTPEISESHTWNNVPAFDTDPLQIFPEALVTIPGDDEQQVAIYG